MALHAADVAAILADLLAQGEGAAVTFGAYSTTGLLRENQELLLDGDASQVERVRTITIKTGTLPGVVAGSSLTLGSTTYVVRDVIVEDDGAVTVLVVTTG